MTRVLYFHSVSFVLPLQMLNIQFVLSLPSCLTTPYLIWIAKYVETPGSCYHLLSPFAVFLDFTITAFCLACSSTDLCFLLTSLSSYGSLNMLSFVPHDIPAQIPLRSTRLLPPVSCQVLFAWLNKSIALP